MHPFFNTLGRLAAAATLVALPHLAIADDWPSKPITLIVPYPPGGFADNVTRSLAAEVSKTLGQPVVVDNRTGASGRIGTDAIIRAPKDGYTIGLGVPATLSLLPATDPRYADLSRQITPITIAVRTEVGLAINPQRIPARNFKEFVAYARSRNGEMAYGSAGNATSSHLWSETLLEAVGVKAVHVPYKGEAPAVTDLLGGQVQFVLISGSVKPHVDSGKLMVIATSGEQRWKLFPDVPTLKELGLDGVAASGWLAYFGPAGVPAGVTEKLNSAFASALKQPSVQKLLEGQGYSAIGSTPQELSAVTAREIGQFDKIIKSGRVKLD